MEYQLSITEKKILSVIQRGFPRRQTPFKEVAEKAGENKLNLLEVINIWKRLGILRRIPIIEKIEHIVPVGIKACLVFISIGIIAGLGFVAASGSGFVAWLRDLKVICILGVWIFSRIILILNHLFSLISKTVAILTPAVCIIVVYAIIGMKLLGTTQHDFTYY